MCFLLPSAFAAPDAPPGLTLDAEAPAPLPGLTLDAEAPANGQNSRGAGPSRPAAPAEKPSYVTPEPLRLPYISHYYVTPRIVAGADKAEIRFYVTDWAHSLVRFGDASARFDVELKYTADKGATWKTLRQTGVPSGDGAFQLGALPAGEYIAGLTATDAAGRVSRTVWTSFQSVEAESLAEKPEEVLRPSAADLAAYGVKAEPDNLYAVVPVDIGDLPAPANIHDQITFSQDKAAYAAMTNAIAAKVAAFAASDEAARLVAAHPAGYVVAAPARGTNFIYRTRRYRRILPGAAYDAAAMETASLTNSVGLERLLADAAAAGRRRVVLPKGVYRVSCARTLRLPSRMTLDLGGATLKLNRFSGTASTPIAMLNVVDAHIVNGVLEGNYFEFDYEGCGTANPEHNGAIFVLGSCRFCSVENLHARNTVSSGINIGMPPKPFFQAGGTALAVFTGKGKDRQKAPWTPGSLDAKGEIDPSVPGRFTSPLLPLNDLASNRFMTVSQLLGYQGVRTKSWYFAIAFYDDAGAFVHGETGYQYHRIFVPRGAASFRVSIEEPEEQLARNTELRAFMLRIPEHCVFRNVTFERCRTCGFGQNASYNQLTEGCEFFACGDESCRCALDAEDGWDGMQNITFRNNWCHDNPNGDFTICCGHDFVFEGNRLRIWAVARNQSALYRGNTFPSARFDCSWMTRTMYARFEDNKFVGNVTLGSAKKDSKSGMPPYDWEIVIANGVFANPAPGKREVVVQALDTGRFRDCTFDGVTRK